MADRWAVVDYLKRGLSLSGDSRLTGVSVTTIGRVADFSESATAATDGGPSPAV